MVSVQLVASRMLSSRSKRIHWTVKSACVSVSLYLCVSVSLCLCVSVCTIIQRYTEYCFVLYRVVRRTKQRKQKEKHERRAATQTKHPSGGPRKSLQNVRVMQRNLVYVIGLPVHFADEEILRSNECFSQYGKIVKAVVNKSHLSADRGNATASAYITFANKEDALCCILAIDGYYLDGSALR